MKKLALFTTLFISLSSSAQHKSKEILSDSIKFKVHQIDTLANILNEDIEHGISIWSHGNMRRRLLTHTSTLRNDGKLLRVCLRKRLPKTDEDLSLYFDNSQLIFAEITIYNDKRKVSSKKLYYHNEFLIHPDYDKDFIEILNIADEYLKGKQ